MDQLKKRHRIPSSCSVCRKRKSKCDRIKPVCGLCRKKSIAHLCYYENVDEPLRTRNQDEMADTRMSNSPLGHGVPLPQSVLLVPPAQPVPPSGGPQLVPPHVNLSQPGLVHGSFSYYPDSYDASRDPHRATAGSISAGPLPPNSGAPTARLAPGTDGPHSESNPPGSGPIPHQQSVPVPLYGQQYHSIAPPPNGPPAPGNVPIMAHPVPPLNYYDENGDYLRQNSMLLAPSLRNSVQLPPIKGSSDGLVVVLIGPNSNLRINPNDEIEDFFDNASFPLLLEGPYLQNHGHLTYVGLTKSDRFIKFFRKFAVELLQKGEISEFVPKKKRKRSSNQSSPNLKKTKSHDSTPMARNSADNSEMSEISPKTIDTKINSIKTGDSMGMSEDADTLSPDSHTVDPVKQDPDAHENSDDDDEDEDEEEEEEEDEDAGEQKDEEDILVITKINVAKEVKEKNKKTKSDPLAVLPGLKALYLGQGSRKEYYKLVEKAVIEVFPSRAYALSLFARFFKWVHPFVPFISEASMLKDFNQIVDEFPSFGKGHYTSFNIKSDKHLNIIGLMLIITRLGYSSLIHNHRIHNQYNEQEIAMFNECKKVSFKVFADVVNLCVPDEHTSMRSSFRMVQLLSLIYFYREVSPNDCHGVGAADSQILFGTIVRHALSIGLNRDPLKYFEHETINKNTTLIQSWRNLWFYIISTDASTAIHRSTVLNIYNDSISDVDLPNSHIPNSELAQTQKAILEISESYRKITALFCNFQQKPKIIEILAETNKLEHIFYRLFGKDFFKDYICKPVRQTNFTVDSKEHEESYVKVMKYFVFILLRANLSSIYNVIAMNYERKYNNDKTTSITSGVELFKIHFKSVVQLVYIMSYVFDNSVELFGKNYDYILTAVDERYMVKTHSFLTSFFIRLIHQKQLLVFKSFEPTVAERLAAINKLFNMILVEAELFVGNFRQLSLRYVNSYKIYVLTYYVLKQCMLNAEVFFKYALSDMNTILETTNLLQYFSASEINYLCKLCEEFRFAKDSQERQRKANVMFNLNLTKGFNNDESPPGMDAPGSLSGDNNSDPLGFNLSSSFAMQFGEQDPSSSTAEPPILFLGMGGLNEDVKTDDFLKFFELYGSTSNTHLE